MPLTLDGTNGVSAVQAGAVESGDLPAGSVIQVVQSTTGTQTNVTSTSYVDIAGLSVSITPSSASSKVLIMCHPNGRTRKETIDFRNYYLAIVRNSTEVFGSFLTDITADLGQASNHVGNGNQNLVYLDSPNTTSSTVYKLQAKIEDPASTTEYNFNAGGGEASIIVMEIAG